MARDVLVTGLGPVCGFGFGVDALRVQVAAGGRALGRLSAFEAPVLTCQLVAECPDFKTRDYVPKTYRKQLKVMARDIELAVVAARLAVQDAALATADPETAREGADGADYPPERLGCHIGSGLIATELDELIPAIAASTAGGDPLKLDLHAWGRGGMERLTPLWLLKYLPNMLACHVTIIHDARGPSNTVTCNEASGNLSIGESMRVIQRGQADACICGGTESKINPMGLVRQQLTGRLLESDGSDPAALRPFDAAASGTAIGEGGGLVVLEDAETFAARGSGGTAHARLLGFGAAQTVNPKHRNHQPDPAGDGIRRAVEAALDDAGLDADAVDFVIPTGLGVPAWDAAEAAALRSVLGDRLAEVPVLAPRAALGSAGAGNDALDLTLAALILEHQQLPPADGPLLHRAQPLPACGATTTARLETALLVSTSLGGQCAALVVGRA